jgi:hypothetical protein
MGPVRETARFERCGRGSNETTLITGCHALRHCCSSEFARVCKIRDTHRHDATDIRERMPCQRSLAIASRVLDAGAQEIRLYPSANYPTLAIPEFVPRARVLSSVGRVLRQRSHLDVLDGLQTHAATL